MKKPVFYAILLILTIALPYLLPAFKTQLATLWLMIIVAMTWDMTGGQMGYNSLGNIFFYGTGMYVAAIITIAMAHDVSAYTDSSHAEIMTFTSAEYFPRGSRVM